VRIIKTPAQARRANSIAEGIIARGIVPGQDARRGGRSQRHCPDPVPEASGATSLRGLKLRNRYQENVSVS